MTNRAQYLRSLQAELELAEGYGDTRRAAELRAQMRRVSAGTPDSPARETTGRKPAGKRTT